MKKNLCFFIAFLGCLILDMAAYGQNYNQRPEFLKANSVWAFGSNAGLNFNTSPTAIFTAITAVEGNASVADPVTGQLQFYSDGGKCWNRNNVVMPNGDNLNGNGNGGLSTTQGVCIVQVKNQPGKYYLFSLNGAEAANGSTAVNGRLFYSIVDMSLDAGFGDIVPGQKNIVLDTAVLSESMIAVPGNNCDVWLLVHAFLEPVFKAYHITSAGIDPNPVISTVGTQIQGNILPVPGSTWGAYMIGGMTISPDRHTLAIASFVPLCLVGPVDSTAGVLLFHFDAATGAVSDALQVEENLVTYSTVFSPDNTKLYMFCYDMVAGNIDLRQYDISTYTPAAVAASKQIIVPTVFTMHGSSTKLYKDTIYLNITSGLNALSRIVQPNLAGVACGYQPAAVPLLSGTFTSYSLPNEAISFLAPDTLRSLFLDTLICTLNGAPFYGLPVTANPGYAGYLWNDGVTTAARTLTQPGKYWVLSIDSCHSRVDTFILHYADVTFSLGPDTFFCDRNTYELKVSLPGVSCLWNDGSTGNSFTASGQSTVWVRIAKEGCFVTDTVKVNARDFRQELGKDVVLCKEEQVSITLNANIPSGAWALWSDGSNTTSVMAKDTGLYWVTVKDDLCSRSDTIRIRKEMCDCFSYMPSAFSPNGDGQNDVFLPLIESGCPISAYTFSIYNRFGQRVFNSAAATKGWDGSYNGSLADAGTYMYELRFEGGTRKEHYYKKGDVILVR